MLLFAASPLQVAPVPSSAFVFVTQGTRSATLQLASPLDYETTSNLTLHLSVTTDYGLSTNATVAVVVQNVNDAPVFVDPFPSAVNVSEAATVGAVVAHFQALDADGDVVLFSMVSPGDPGAFQDMGADRVLRLDSSTGILSVVAPLDFERRTAFTLEVSVTDRSGGSGLVTVRNVVVTVLDINDIRVTSVAPAQLSTLGGDLVFLSGTNFGPAPTAGQSSARVTVVYGPVTDPSRYAASGCMLVDSNLEVQCNSAPGAGGGLVWTVCVEGVCGVPSSVATSYAAPVVTAVLIPSGVMQTRGGDAITVLGLNFGNASDAAVNASVVVTYSPGGLGTVTFTAVTCALQPRAAGADPMDASGAIVCTSAEGAGANLLWRVSVAGLASEWSPESTAAQYAAPEIVSLAAPLLKTRGGDTVALAVLNGGPSGPAFPVRARYGYRVTATSHDFWYEVPCTVVTPHTAVECVAAPGSGAGLVWELLVGGQWSDVAAGDNTTSSYAPPVVSGVSGDQLLLLSTTGNQVVTLHGDNFGPVVEPGDHMRRLGIGAVYANGSLTAMNCAVTVAHLAMTCLTAEGTGTGHGWQVVVAYQSSSQYFHDFGNGVVGTRYAPPLVSSFRMIGAPLTPATALATEGGEGIVIVGRNFGPTVATLMSVAYSSSSGGGMTFEVDTRACFMPVPHEEVVCATVPGAGAGMQWLLVVDGQVSTNPFTSYAPPEVHGLRGPGVDATALSTDGGSELFVVGKHFGPVYDAGNMSGA
jgi:hypothetical protein